MVSAVSISGDRLVVSTHRFGSAARRSATRVTPADDLLAVVQDQQHIQPADGIDDPIREITYAAPWPAACGELRFAPPSVAAMALTRRRRRGSAAAHRRHCGPPGQFGAHPVGRRGLTDSAGALHRDQPMAAEQGHDGRDVVVAADEIDESDTAQRLSTASRGPRVSVPDRSVIVRP